MAILNALRDWPRLPSPDVLIYLSYSGRFSDDWERGKRMQLELAPGRIPAKTEAEVGAGFWDRITDGKWRDVEDTPNDR